MICLQSIVGGTQSNNSCIVSSLTEEQRAELAISKSGLYLDELPGIHLKAAANTDVSKPLYEMVTKSIKGAVQALEESLVMKLNQKYQKNRNNYIGTIGRMSFSQTLPAGRRFRGMRLRPVDASDAVITLSRIMAIQNATGPYNVKLLRAPLNSVMGEVLQVWTINGSANAYSQVMINQPNGLELPLMVNGEAVEYWIYYDSLEVGGLPKNTDIECGPCLKKAGGTGITDYLTVHGVEFDAEGNLSNVTANNLSQGLILDVKIQCDNKRLFCREYDENEATALVMAHAVQHRAGQNLVQMILDSPDISRYTTMDREALYRKRSTYKNEFETRMDYLAATIDVTSGNCFVCREAPNQPSVQTVFI